MLLAGLCPTGLWFAKPATMSELQAKISEASVALGGAYGNIAFAYTDISVGSHIKLYVYAYTRKHSVAEVVFTFTPKDRVSHLYNLSSIRETVVPLGLNASFCGLPSGFRRGEGSRVRTMDGSRGGR